MLHSWNRIAIACLAMAALPAVCQAQVKVAPVIAGLLNPSGVAVQPGSGHLFIADSGALRILRLDPAAADKAHSVIKGFTKDIYGKGPMYDIGPLGVAFLDQNTLAVGDGGKPDGQELAYVFAVPESGKAIQVSDAKQTLGPIAAGEESQKGEGNFYGLAVANGAAYITSNGDDTKGWVLKFDYANGKAGALKPFIATKVAVNVDAPVGITTDKEGRLVIGQMGEINVPGDSLLTIYDAKGKLVAKAETGLFDIAGLAYSPKSGKLYAVDYAWMDSAKGGLYRLDTKLDGDKLTVKAELVTSLDKPTALAFTPDGSLYVTLIGTAKSPAEDRPGSLVKITGDL